ncbi:CRAL/TRIO domain containing protein, putative [Leishmania guyanensis]|uniref:CRAL-TRIO domain-containing protein n=1 Tax=Leishmania guyanensis TaxID=5670 RepID=A0A1E1J9Q3_LEIGU|nr:hypothetical protein, conserved [Leishmania guyanensis]
MPGEASDDVVATTSADWEMQYERDFDAQQSSGPFMFSESERRKNRELFSRLRDLLPFDDAYKVSDCDLMYRFLIGKHWNVAKAESGIRKYVQLRKSDNFDSIIGEQLHPTISSVLSPMHNGMPCPIYGLDREGLPVLWLSPDADKLAAAMKDFTNEQLLRCQLWSMELGRYVCLRRKVDRCTYVVDLGGITMSSVNKATLALLKSVMGLLQVAYPEIMRRLLFFNMGWTVSAAWKVLRPLVDVRVQDKIKFESGPPTLAALQQYITADQVHPSFGGTGSVNALDTILDAEVRRIRARLEDRAPPQPAADTVSITHRPSVMSCQDASQLSGEALTLYSICSTPPGTTCSSPNESPSPESDVQTEKGERVVVGAHSAVTAWLAKTNAAKGTMDALDVSLNVVSWFSEYDCDKEEASSTPVADDAAKYPSHGAALLSLHGSPTNDIVAPSHESEPVHVAKGAGPTMQQQTELPSLTISLTYGADGSISGYCRQQWIGCFKQGLFYTPTLNDEDSTSQWRFSSLLPPPQCSTPRDCAGRSVGMRWGELLYEAGHPLHNFLIVCDAQRRARYLLRVSRLRTRLTIYSIVGDAAIHTEKNNRHYVEGERAKLGVVVPHSSTISCGDKGAWMLYGEDVTKRLSRNPTRHLQQLLSKAKRAVSTAKKSGSGAPQDKASNGRWSASIFSTLPPSPLDQYRKDRDAAVDGGTQLLAECKGQTISFYKLLTENSLSDLFALTVAITQSWNNEMGSYKNKAVASKATLYSSEDDVIA